MDINSTHLWSPGNASENNKMRERPIIRQRLVKEHKWSRLAPTIARIKSPDTAPFSFKVIVNQIRDKEGYFWEVIASVKRFISRTEYERVKHVLNVDRSEWIELQTDCSKHTFSPFRNSKSNRKYELRSFLLSTG